jgi:FG-GAP-like repeat
MTKLFATLVLCVCLMTSCQDGGSDNTSQTAASEQTPENNEQQTTDDQPEPDAVADPLLSVCADIDGDGACGYPFGPDCDDDADGYLSYECGGSDYYDDDPALHLNSGTGWFSRRQIYVLGGSSPGFGKYNFGIDFNDDCLTDIFSEGNYYSPLFINTGNDYYTSFAIDDSVTPPLYESNSVVADFDGNGHKDVAYIDPGTKSLNLSLNQGGFDFVNQVTPAGTASLSFNSDLITGDMNLDGFPDLAALDDSYHLVIMFNDGSGDFSTQQIYDPQLTDPAINFHSIVYRDFDNDGLSDIVIGSRLGLVKIYFNNGSGTFDAEVRNYNLPGYYIFEYSDFEGDGNNDLLLARLCEDVNCMSLPAFYVVSGNGDGTFATPVSFPIIELYPLNLMAAGDVDADNDLDIAITTPDTVTIYKNVAGELVFSESFDYVVFITQIGMSFFEDLNKDGFEDLVILEESATTLIYNDGQGNFAPESTYSQTVITSALDYDKVIPGDFNGDNYPDLAYTNSDSNEVGVYLNDAAGGFIPDPSPLAISAGNLLTEINLDGDFNLDLAVINSAGNSLNLLANDGDGNFTLTYSYPSTSTIIDLVKGDVNGDGLHDLLILTRDSGVLVAANNGDGSLAAYRQVIPDASFQTGEEYYQIIPADHNSDGYADLLLAYIGTQSNCYDFYDNNGNGNYIYNNTWCFYDLIAYNDTWGFYNTNADLRITDVNGDGHTDILVSECNHDTSGELHIYYNNGDGSFSEYITIRATYCGANPVSSDFNGDGQVDIAMVTEVAGLASLGINFGDGAGGFISSPIFMLDSLDNGHDEFFVRDFDLDGVIDIGATSDGTGVTIFIGK